MRIKSHELQPGRWLTWIDRGEVSDVLTQLDMS